MSTFAEDNFGNDGAQEYLAMLTARLMGTITEVMARADRLKLTEDGESMLMPSVEILALLFERYDAAPPRPETVRQWSAKYLKVYDKTIDKLKPTADYKSHRRRVIENTFRWLESLAQTHYAAEGDPQ